MLGQMQKSNRSFSSSQLAINRDTARNQDLVEPDSFFRDTGFEKHLLKI